MVKPSVQNTTPIVRMRYDVRFIPYDCMRYCYSLIIVYYDISGIYRKNSKLK